MAKNVTINGVTYQNVPYVQIPLTADPSENAEFYDTSDATLASGGQMLSGYTAYANGTKYTGSIASKSSSDLTVSGATVTAPAGYYSSSASKAVASGSATTPTDSITSTVTISVNSSTGLITASASGSKSITPNVSAGYVSAGTAGTISTSGSATEQLTVKSQTAYTPGTSDQTISAGTYLTGVQTIYGDTNLQAQYIKSGISIFGVDGTLTSATVSQDSTTKVLTIS